MAHVNKKPSTTSDAPLSDREISMTVGLLHRAVAFGQVPKVMDVYKNSLAPKGEFVQAAALLNEANEVYQHGSSPSLAAMTDAVKRRVAFDEDEVSDWDTISPAALEVSSSLRIELRAQSKLQSPIWRRSLHGVPASQWGKSVCKMPKEPWPHL